MTVKPTKEYFRKPYLVEDKADSEESEHSDYRYMMDTDWQGLQDSSYIVVQSVRKKPYAEDDYEEMEQKANGYTGIDWYLNWNWYRPKFNWGATFSTIEPEYQPTIQTRKLTGRLSWIQCPTTVGVSKTYTIIVKNSYSSQRTYTGGRLQYNRITHVPSNIYLEKKTPASRGLAITRVWQRNSVTYATLGTSSTASGEYYIYASDGTNTIERTISISSSANGFVFTKITFPPFTLTYYKIQDLVEGNEIPYAAFTAESGRILSEDAGVYSTDVTSEWVASYTVLNSTLYKLYASGTKVASVDYKLYYDYADGSITVSYVSGDGKLAGAPPPQVYSRLIKETLTPTALGSDIYNGYTYHIKFPGVNLFSITDTYSAYLSINGGTTTTDKTGDMFIKDYYIDSASYIMKAAHYSGSTDVKYYHISGMYNGSGVSFNLTWSPTVQFGKV